jgi:hypothetical protein
MTTITAVLIQAQDAPIAQTTKYTSTGVQTIIDKFTATNTTAGPLTIAVNLVPAAGAAGSGNLIRPAKTLLAGEVYRFPELVGQLLAVGDFISIIASATGVTVKANGRQITAS